jgi:hypothetical protein
MGSGLAHSRLLQQPSDLISVCLKSPLGIIDVGRIKQCAIPKIVRTNDLYEDL